MKFTFDAWGFYAFYHAEMIRTGFAFALDHKWWTSLSYAIGWLGSDIIIA